MKNIFYIIIFLYTVSCSSQSFEGQVTYKHTFNPIDDKMFGDNESLETFRESIFGEDGHRIEKSYYKENRFLSEYTQDLLKYKKVYKPEKEKIYFWKENTETFVDQKTNVLAIPDDFIEFVSSKETITILNIQCKKILLKTKMGITEIWYNEDYLKIDPKDYSEFKLDHLNLIYQKIGCLPFKTISAGYTIEVIDFKSIKVADESFELPGFILKQEKE